MRTIKEWQRASYELAVEKGFYDCRVCAGTGDDVRACDVRKGTGRVDHQSPTRIASRLAMIHCEISEAVECVARGRMELYFVTANGSTIPIGSKAGVKNAAGDHVLVELSDAEWVARGLKPEGFGIELADVFLLLCNLAESLELELVNDGPGGCPLEDTSPEGIAAALCVVHDMLPHAFYCDEDFIARSLSDALSAITWVAQAANVDLLAMAELKHTWNKGRSRMHGKVL